MQIRYHKDKMAVDVNKIEKINATELNDYLKNLLKENKMKRVETVWTDNGRCWGIDGDSGMYDVIEDVDEAVKTITERVAKFGFAFFGGEFGEYEGVTVVDKDSDAYLKSVANKRIDRE